MPCTPPGNSGGSWSWCIGNLGAPGFISFNQNSTFPIFFTMSNGVQGEIVGASSISITIQWNCNDCTGDVSHINIFFGCDEIYQSSVFVQCSDCSYNTWDCVSTDCSCIKVCINGVVETLQNTGGSEVFFCYPEGTNIGAIKPCNEELICRNRPGNDKPLPEVEVGARSAENNQNYITIPDVKIVQTNQQKGNSNLSIALPDLNTTFELLVSDNMGRVIHQKQLVNQHEAVIQLKALSTGIYHILLTDGNYRISQKVFIQ